MAFFNFPTVTAESVEIAASGLGTKAQYGGAGASIASWALSSEAGFIFGVLLALVGYLTNLHFQRRRDKREREYHEARMKALHAGEDEPA